MSSVGELVGWARELLSRSSQSHSLDAEILAARAFNTSRAQVIAFSEKQVSADQESQFRALVARRHKHEPIAYILGVKEFYGREFSVSPSVLIPRPETELLVERAVDFLKHTKLKPTVLDLGTGSGCIAISIALEAKRRRIKPEILAIDKSEAALSTARENARALGAQEYLSFARSDWFLELPSNSQFSVIVSNPPYVVPESSGLSPELQFEPSGALYSGPDGLNDIKRILAALEPGNYLAPGGIFLCEIGAAQQPTLTNLLAERFPTASYTFHPDLAGLPRVLELRLR